MTQRETGIEQRSDNTYVRKPRIEEPIERTVHGVKWSELDFKTQLANMGNRVDGYPTERGLEIVSPEFDIISGVRGLLNVAKTTTIPMKLKSTYYNKAPWTFKPNPDSYYRAMPKEAIDDAIETGVIRHKPKSSKFLELLELKNSPDPEIASKASLEFSKLSRVDKMNVGSRSAPGQTYFMKGRPLTRVYAEKYNKPVSHFGDYIIEVSDNVPFIPLKTKGRLVPEVMENLEKNYNPEIKGLAIPKANVLPEKVIPLDENVKLYKPDWFRGFKEIKTRKYQSGGSFKPQVVKGKTGLKLIESVNNRSKANFVQRLNNSERQHIQDWETPNKIATHKMSWATEGEKAIVFPMVQEINGSLHDFSNPKYNHKKWDALDNAINKGDTLIMTPDQAKWFTENYKNFYPKFGKGEGGAFKSQLFALTNRSPDGRPLEQGLKNVYPEMALAGFVRAGMMGALPSFKNSAISTASGITSRQVKDKLTKGLEQATNTGETINDAVRNSAKAIVIKTSKEVVKRLPEAL